MPSTRAFRIRFFDASEGKLKELVCLKNEDLQLDGLNRALFMGLITWTQRSKKLPAKCVVQLEFDGESAELNIPDSFLKWIVANGFSLGVHINQ